MIENILLAGGLVFGTIAVFAFLDWFFKVFYLYGAKTCESTFSDKLDGRLPTSDSVTTAPTGQDSYQNECQNEFAPSSKYRLTFRVSCGTHSFNF